MPSRDVSLSVFLPHRPSSTDIRHIATCQRVHQILGPYVRCTHRQTDRQTGPILYPRLLTQEGIKIIEWTRQFHGHSAAIAYTSHENNDILSLISAPLVYLFIHYLKHVKVYLDWDQVNSQSVFKVASLLLLFLVYSKATETILNMCP